MFVPRIESHTKIVISHVRKQTINIYKGGQTASGQCSSGTGISWTIMPAILAAIPAGIIAAGKAAASVGVTATGAVVGYGVIRDI